MNTSRRDTRIVLICGASLLFGGASQAQVSVLTWHNDNARTGQNLQETVLTPANVNASHFGKLFVISVDGGVDAQPLYVPTVTIPGQGIHNVLYVMTENDSAYAFEADAGILLWHVTLLGANETPSDTRSCGQVTPEIGITATPAIDLAVGAHGTLYAVAMSKDGSGNYHQRLHALDLTTGAEEFNGPKEVQASYQWSGAGNVTGTVTFDPKQYKERPGLLILNGAVYTSWSSHCDHTPYGGWVIGYNETNLAQVSVLDLTPNRGSSNGGAGSVWMSGAGPAADPSGNIYLLTGNGVFDTTLTNGFPDNNDYGNAFVRISTSGGTLTVADYFTMDNTTSESGGDVDLGSGGLMLLPPLAGTGGTVSLVVGAGKDTNIYVVNQSNMGKFSSTADSIYQQMTGVLPGGVWSSPAWFNGYLYYGDVGDHVKAFAFASGQFSTGPSSQSPSALGYPGATPSISANGTSDGIVWAVENASPAVLHAYDASNLANELYNSSQATNSRDTFGAGNKYMVPTVVNGKVYVGTPNSIGVFGLLPSAVSSPPSAVSVSPDSGDGSAQTFTFTFGDPNGASDITSAQFVINSSLVESNGCYLYFYAGGVNRIYLANDTGALSAPMNLGNSGTLQNSHCSVNVGASSVSSTGSTLTVILAITFAPAFAGTKNVYMYAQNASLGTGWVQSGTWMVPGSLSPPSAVSVAPKSGSGLTQTFAFTFSDAAGASDILSAQIVINSSLTGTSSCYLYFYGNGANVVYMASDAGSFSTGLPLGNNGTSQNSQCAVNAGASSISIAGDILTLNLAMTFTPAFAGSKNIYMFVQNSALGSGWALNGTWTVPGASAPTAVSVMPNSGSGSAQTFAFTFSDAAGATDISSAQIVINSSLTGANACYLYLFASGTNVIYLANDAGVFQNGLAIGESGTAQNSQCSVNAGASSISRSGTTLTLNLALTFQPAFAGAKSVYLFVQNATLGSGWGQAGSWTP